MTSPTGLLPTKARRLTLCTSAEARAVCRGRMRGATIAWRYTAGRSPGVNAVPRSLHICRDPCVCDMIDWKRLE